MRQAQASNTNDCTGIGNNNLLGCGFQLGQVAGLNCDPLNRQLTYISCNNSLAWDCGPWPNLQVEALHVIKPSPAEGGALCCRD